MEALAAVALAGNVAQFLEYAIILVSRTPEILSSTDRALKEITELEDVIDDVQQSFQGISLSNQTNESGATSDKTLEDLTKRCLAISEEVMDIVKGLKLKASGDGIIQGAAMVTKSLFKMPKLKELSGRLYALRDQVSAHLIILIRQQQQELGLTLQKFTTSSEEFQAETEAKLQKVLSYLQQISEQVTVQQTADQSKPSRRGKSKKARARQNAWNDEPAKPKYILELHLVRPHLDSYVQYVEKWVDQKQKSILQSLYFSQLKDREFAVAEAHKNTLEWIFKQNSSTHFVEWLYEENGVYWIAGKAGSGKSTLMKFLTDHPTTLHHLGEWAGEKSLIIAKHYFWSSGTSIQKSQEGLFRALLLQILSNRPNLIQTVCANRWNAQYTDSFNPWSRAELARALENLGAIDDPGCKMCLFIDGLDEYDGDHAQLVRVIRKIGDSKNIKICASSRPWLSFSDAFENSRWKLYLQDLTYGDIRRFIQDNLQEDERFNRLQQRNRYAADELISEITKRANGVFLWVFLVVRSILRGLGNEDTISDLQRRLQELPSDLQEYFDRMLSSIEEVYIKRVARLFLTMSYAQTTFPVITFYFMDFGDESFSSKPLPFLRTWPDVDASEAEALSTKKRQLIAQCRDLIYISPDPGAPVLFAERVGFLHRTVVDFLHTANIEEKLLRLAEDDFNPTKILLGANLGQARQWILGTLYYAHEIEVSSGTAEVDALDELDSIITREYRRWGFAHAMECIFDMPEIASFWELACKCDLASYVSHKHPQCTPRELNTLAPGWRELLKVVRDSNFELRGRQVTNDMGSDWRVGRAVGVVGSSEDKASLHVRTRDTPPAEIPAYHINPKRGVRSKIARAFNKLRS
ncbi:hypothetical protein O1611_g1316 [Lasiodiplodia mahajangana]|uniref:Uncharacterized protein n=1 Tax=Lasiodiplodia mahajangana TaxID=1108764 RepID=A0ACC2JYF6_9PEZI|nr:hypothetical protein O1611_g1316 [Lasiodiplodia mahajangana]